jgi:hypothetical protein
MRIKLKCGLVIALSLASSLARADSLELVNGSLIQGESEISFQVGSSVQKYGVPDIAAVKFDSHGVASAMPMGVHAPASVADGANRRSPGFARDDKGERRASIDIGC